MTGMHSPNIIEFGLFRVVEICLGILCATAVSLVVFPRKKADVLRKKLESQAMGCSENCNLLVEAFITKQQNVDESKLLHIRKEGLTSRFDVKRLVQVFSFFSSLKYFAEDILSGADKILSNHPLK